MSHSRHLKSKKQPLSASRGNRQSPDEDYDENPDGEATTMNGMANARPTLQGSPGKVNNLVGSGAQSARHHDSDDDGKDKLFDIQGQMINDPSSISMLGNKVYEKRAKNATPQPGAKSKANTGGASSSYGGKGYG